jgi:DASS family divalent anion:Na+ symporter
MYAALLGVGVSLGIPPMLLAMMLGFMGSIYGVLTITGTVRLRYSSEVDMLT